MADGVIAELAELIDLRRYTQATHYQPKARAVRSGGHLSKIRGRGMEFSEVRNYQAGDEIRHMEWRVTARTGRPHIKLYQEERERPVVVLADFNPSMIFGTRIAFKSVVAARLAALLAWTTIAQGDRIGGLFFSATKHNEFIPRSRETAVLPMLASLSGFTNQTDHQREQKPCPLNEALIRVRRVIRPGSILVMISDFYLMDSECEKQLHRLRGHNDILAFQICDKVELTPPKPQQYALSNGINELLLDTEIPAISTAYAQYCQQRTAMLAKQFKDLQIPYRQLTAESNLPELVRQIFSRRKHG